MKARLHSELRASEILWNDFKLAKKAGRRSTQISPWIFRLMALAFIGSRAFLSGSLDFVIALIVLWTLAMFFWRADQLLSSLYDSTNLAVFENLPIAEKDIFKIQFKLFLRASLWSVLDFAICYWALISKSGAIFSAVYVGIGLGLIQWVFIVATALVLLAFGPMRWSGLLGWLLTAGTLVFAFFGEKQALISEGIAGAAYWIPPVGWVLHALGISASAGLAHDFAPAVISALLLCLAPLAYRKIKQNYSLSEAVAEETESPGESTRLEDETKETVRSRRFLSAFDWLSAGWIERSISRVLTSREKTIAEFMVAADPSWTKSLRNFALMWSAFLLGALLLVVQFKAEISLVFVPGLLLLYFMFLNIMGNWRGFDCSTGVGLQSPIFAHYPIGFWELARTMSKINLARFLFYIPKMCVVSLGVGFLFGKFALFLSMMESYGAKLIFLILCIQPLLIIAPISPATNDTKRIRFAILSVLGILLLLASGAIFFFAKDWRIILPSASMTALFSVGALFLYGRMFNRNKFDLVPLAKGQMTPQ